jgi:hypothetical protein
MNKKLTYICNFFYPTTPSQFSFIRHWDNGGRSSNKNYEIAKVSRASRDRVERILRGSLVKQISEQVRIDYAHGAWEIQERPTRFSKDVYQGIGGRLVMTLTPRERVALRRECRTDKPEDNLPRNEYDYRKMNYAMMELFDSVGLEFFRDAGEAGYAMFSGPVVLDRVYSDDGVEYSDIDDETNWKKSRMWFYNWYAYRHPVEDLIKHGYVEFDYVRDED